MHAPREQGRNAAAGLRLPDGARAAVWTGSSATGAGEELDGSPDPGKHLCQDLSPELGPGPGDDSCIVMGESSGNARSAIVNRTHRVVRERATAMQARRRAARSLALPLLICSALLLMVCHAVWATVSQSSFGIGELGAVGEELEETAGKLLNGQAMDAGGPVYLLLMWFLPVSVLTLAIVLFRRTRSRHDDEVLR